MTRRTIETSLGPIDTTGQMRTSKEWMREDTWHFEVEVLGIYGAPRAVVTRFGARPVSDAPYQPVDAADVRRRVVFGARQ